MLSEFNEIWILSRQIFEKYWNIKFYAMRSVGAELFLEDRRTDGHDKANSRFSQFCENRQRNHTARRFMQDIRNVRRYELDTFWTKHTETNRLLLLISSYSLRTTWTFSSHNYTILRIYHIIYHIIYHVISYHIS